MTDEVLFEITDLSVNEDLIFPTIDVKISCGKCKAVTDWCFPKGTLGSKWQCPECLSLGTVHFVEFGESLEVESKPKKSVEEELFTLGKFINECIFCKDLQEAYKPGKWHKEGCPRYSEVKSCPFCFGPSYKLEVVIANDHYPGVYFLGINYAVRCNNCGCLGPYAGHTHEQAVSLWNDRRPQEKRSLL